MNNIIKKTKSSLQLPMKLIKYLSLCKVASRRKCFEFILDGRVKINGIVISEPSTEIKNSDKIEFDNKRVEPQNFVYIALNKPSGFTCTNSDPYAGKKAIDLINLPQYRLFSVGRLDKYSEGLLIFTNDGEFSNRLTHPRNGIQKTYIVTTTKVISDTNLKLFVSGIEDEGEFLKVSKIFRLAPCKYSFTLNEGKKREIRRLITHCNSRVKTLKRVSIGKLQLGSLPRGKWKFISRNDVM